MKQIASNKLVLSFIIFVSFITFHSTSSSADLELFKWNITEDGCLVISGEGIIPPEYHPWEESGWNNLQSVTSIVFSEGITEIGDFVISSYQNIRSISFPDSLKVIGAYNFQYLVNLENISFPEGLTQISYMSFIHCDKLTSVFIPSSVSEIGYSTFTRCTSLSSISVAEDNLTYESIDGVLFKKREVHRDDPDYKTLACYPANKKDTIYVVPSDVKRIGEGAFAECKSLEEVVLPHGLVSISGSFYDCTSLRRLTLPKTLMFLDTQSFYNCNLLQAVEIPDSVTYMGNSIFPSTTTIICSKDSVADLYARQNGHHILYSEELKKNTIPDTLTEIGDEAFLDSNLETIYISDNVTSIGKNAFSQDTIIICNVDSYADTWARLNGYLVINTD